MGLGRMNVLGNGGSTQGHAHAQAHGPLANNGFESREDADPPQGANALGSQNSISNQYAVPGAEIVGLVNERCWPRVMFTSGKGHPGSMSVHANRYLCCGGPLVCQVGRQFRRRFRMRVPPSQLPAVAALSATNRFVFAPYI